jgi:hypothetical protein
MPLWYHTVHAAGILPYGIWLLTFPEVHKLNRWPDINMPYAARTGMRPDLIINPHAFPSRMTIGMLLESMGAKAGALTGAFFDASAFQASDGKPGERSRGREAG